MRKCSIEDCESIHWGKGWCRMHYARWYKHGDPLTSKRAVGENRLKHPLYLTHKSMLQRCNNPNASRYGYYGGRGIRVCERWQGKEGFSNFLIDMGERPKGLELDRIDNNSDYSPENCRWTTRTTQNINKRRGTRNKSGVVGVSWYNKDKKWSAELQVGGLRIRLGLFIEKADAVKARKVAEKRYFTPLLEGK